MPTSEKQKTKRFANEQLLLNEIQLLLAEKRTYLSLLRTGLAVFTLPLTVIAVLAATAEYHGLYNNFFVAIVVIAGLGSVSAIGLSIFYRSEYKIKKLNRMIQMIERENKRIAEIVI